eukprot:CAMPEP_0174748766 /NCGR_PEP_ID=MMETSP1094-20130205/94194_1 /TAXON_ID=156173 /ORGANISM="Chrysochromulina brevifilum, Strain UTEX LB 985" /LENGTH=68 /DNA_ID=CAMNT_0015953859 /DNA_START=126 /DNA_END=328 /DNA_ORIENTATION=+
MAEARAEVTTFNAASGAVAHSHSAPPPLPLLPADGKYKILPRGDFETMLKDVGTALERGACIGVFPEG